MQPGCVRIYECTFLQQKKCLRTTQKSMEDAQKWIEQLAPLKEYSTKFAKITGEQLLRLNDNELFNDFAIHSAVDRLYVSFHLFATRPFALNLLHAARYLLLQLERSREHQQATARLRNQIDANITTEAGLLVEEEREEESNLARVQSIEMALVRE